MQVGSNQQQEDIYQSEQFETYPHTPIVTTINQVGIIMSYRNLIGIFF
jgi:hypothetical protein